MSLSSKILFLRNGGLLQHMRHLRTSNAGVSKYLNQIRSKSTLEMSVKKHKSFPKGLIENRKAAHETVKIKINNVEFDVTKGTNIIKACEESGEKLSRYCYSERLAISGNCRMCLVEVKGAMKPVVGCVEKVREGMEIFTKSAMVKKSREGVMELLLVNHPLDCPVCDQGGECDLQEESMRVGTEAGRTFSKTRREVRDKNFGNLVSAEMKRCISCSRCVRYFEEVTGKESLGLVGRGEMIEISRYKNETIKMKMSGNVIDLCPVGKLIKT